MHIVRLIRGWTDGEAKFPLRAPRDWERIREIGSELDRPDQSAHKSILRDGGWHSLVEKDVRDRVLAPAVHRQDFVAAGQPWLRVEPVTELTQRR